MSLENMYSEKKIYILISLMFQKSVVGMQKYEALACFEQKHKLLESFIIMKVECIILGYENCVEID